MKTKPFLLLLTCGLLLLSLTSCTLKASTPPVSTTPTVQVDATFPVPGTETMGVFTDFGTQTTIAQTAQAPLILNTPEAPPAVEPTNPPPPIEVQPPPTQAVQPPAESYDVPAEALEVPSSYTLQKGEHPYCIARRFDLNPSTLLSTNGLSANSQVYPGTILRIPAAGGDFPGNRSLISHPARYTVRTGDTIYSIACLYGDVHPLEIAAANGLREPYTLDVGDTLQIP